MPCYAVGGVVHWCVLNTSSQYRVRQIRNLIPFLSYCELYVLLAYGIRVVANTFFVSKFDPFV